MYIYYLQTLFIGKHYRLHRCDDQKHHNIDDFTKPTIIAWFSPRGRTLYGHTCPHGFTRVALFKGRIQCKIHEATWCWIALICRYTRMCLMQYIMKFILWVMDIMFFGYMYVRHSILSYSNTCEHSRLFITYKLVHVSLIVT